MSKSNVCRLHILKTVPASEDGPCADKVNDPSWVLIDVWQRCDLDMTLQWPWGNNPVKYNPISTCLLRLGLIRSNQCLIAIGQNITSVCYLDNFFHIRQYWHKDDGKGGGMKNPLTLIPVTSQGCFGVGLCRDLGMLQAIIWAGALG